MKKALTFASLLAGNVLIAFAADPVVGITVNTTGAATAGTSNANGLLGLLAIAQTLVQRLVPFAVGVAVLVFFWYLIQFIIKGNADAAAKDASVKGMGYSILALFVMVSIWGLIGFLGNLLGIGQGGGAPIPGVPVPADIPKTTTP
jgi:hypothetical protein